MDDFEQFLAEQWGQLRRKAAMVSGSGVDAEEVLQDSLLKFHTADLHHALPRLEWGPVLNRTIANCAIDADRRRMARHPIARAGWYPDPVDGDRGVERRWTGQCWNMETRRGPTVGDAPLQPLHHRYRPRVLSSLVPDGAGEAWSEPRCIADVEQTVIDADLVDRIIDVLDRELPPQWKPVFLARTIEGMTGPEAAAHLGLKPGQAAGYYSRACQWLRVRFAGDL